MTIKFKFKIGDLVYHKTDETHACGFIIVTRKITEGVSGGKAAWYDCSNIGGFRNFAEVELEKG